jgi:hypothetical protein
MLNLIPKSRGTKTLGIGITYHYESGAKFATCPSSCSLMPDNVTAAAEFDSDYAESVSVSVPREGYSFTYSHFDPNRWADLYRPGRTVINSSAGSVRAAARRHKNGLPTVMDIEPTAPPRFSFAGVDFRACPATLAKHINCGNCGGSRGPICAQADRNWVVTFPWHGPPHVLAKAIESGAPRCYGADGRVGMQWGAMASGPVKHSESDLEPWTATLRPGSRLRHHVVGDLGRAA